MTDNKECNPHELDVNEFTFDDNGELVLVCQKCDVELKVK